MFFFTVSIAYEIKSLFVTSYIHRVINFFLLAFLLYLRFWMYLTPSLSLMLHPSFTQTYRRFCIRGLDLRCSANSWFIVTFTIEERIYVKRTEAYFCCKTTVYSIEDLKNGIQKTLNWISEEIIQNVFINKPRRLVDWGEMNGNKLKKIPKIFRLVYF